MKQLTRSEFNKDGTTYKSVTSPSNDDVTQITDIAVKNEHLAYSTDGDTFTALTDEVQVVDDISTIYASENALPTNDVATGTVACALHNGVLPMTLYKFNGTSWDEIDQVRAGVLYQDKATGLIYVFKSTSPYFDATSYTDTSQLTNGANFATTSDVTNATSGKQDTITSSNKLSADLVDDSDTVNKFVTTTEKQTWNGKQDALTFDTTPTNGSNNPVTSEGIYTALSTKQGTLSQTQLDAVNSGIDSTLVAQIGTNQSNIADEVTARQNADTTLQNNIDAKYTKPTTGIPKTDLASAVQTSLGKADSALQSINSSDVTTALGYTPYEKPSGGIPSTDMTSAVQTSLGKADSALQSISSSDVTTALGYTPYNNTNPNGYTKVESSSTNGNIKINGNETTVYTLPNTIATTSDVTAVANRVTTIEGEIPSQASSSNQLADKDFVNSSINAFAAYYITKNAAGDPFATKAELTAATTFYSGGVARVPTTNDYCIVLADESKQSETGVDPTTRYSYQNNQWEYQYTINDTPLTSAQLAALNSGITSALVTQIGTNTTAIAGKQATIDSSHKLSADLVDDTSTTNKFVTATDKTTWNAKQDALTAGTNITIDANNVISAQTSASVTVDDTLSTTSENPVQNKVITNALDNKLPKTGANLGTSGFSLTAGTSIILTGSNGAALLAGAGRVTLQGSYTNPRYYNTNTSTYTDLALTSDIPAQLTSINGLSGGSLTSPLIIKGGDAATAAKLALDQTASGQITNNGTQTLFGFTTNNATTLAVGHSSYAMALRGSGTKPTYNGNNMALVSDIPTAVSQLTNDSGYVTADTGATSVTTSGSGNAFTSASYDATTRKITFTKGSTFLTSAPVSSVAGYTGAVSATNLISAILTGAASYGDKISAKSMAANGYITFSSGLKIAWGVCNHGSSGYDWTASVSFGITFTNKPAVVSTPLEASGSGCWSYVYQSLSTTGCTLRQTSKPNANGKAQYVYWIAVGY